MTGWSLSLIIESIPPAKNGNLSITVKNILKDDLKLPDAVINDFDKCNRVGSFFKDKGGNQQQNTFVRFKSHSSQYKTYLKRKHCHNNNDNIRISPSLTDKRRKLLLNAHSDIKIKLTESIDNELFHEIKSLEDVEWLLLDAAEIDWSDNTVDN